ncbi:hypothetical protein PIB30_054856 [Stylosanthes scabra]|uniref:Uncharacterized protein n=1 Tax=Stylosanthes scabra TaxID=79078 RepID=A0ABU6ULV9_9FABA|nr:hypothetical protein [Stylosanthes scabra]
MVLQGSTNDGYSVLVLDRSGLAIIIDRVQVQAWKVGEVSVKISVCLAFSKGQVFRRMSWRIRGVSV